MIAVLLAFVVPGFVRRRHRLAAVPASPEQGVPWASAAGEAGSAWHAERGATGPMAGTAPPAKTSPTTAATPRAAGTAPLENIRPRRNTMPTPARPQLAARPTARLQLRYGRLAVALVAALAAVVLVIGGVLAPFGVVPGMVPLAALATLVAGFLALRIMAVQGRRRASLARMERAFAEAMQAPGHPAPPRRQTEVFNAQPASAAPVRTPEVEQLRAEALRMAAAEPVKTTWDPVDVPRPAYVSAERAERPAPAPLPAAEEKKPQHVTSILQETRIAAQPAQLAEAEGASVGRLSGGAAPAAQPGATGRINLDAVLQRRRA